jgi:hypothetical protein
VLSVTDIATALASTQRWNGATIVPWSVAQHCLAMYEVAKGANRHPLALMTVLHHDDEEVATGDIPQPFKGQEQEEMGDSLRQEIWKDTLKLTYEPPKWLDEIDSKMAAAEAQILCHPNIRALFDPAPDRYLDVVWDLLDMTRREQVHAFVTITEALLAEPRVRAMRGRN